MVHLYNGILVRHKKEWSIDTYCNMNELWRYFASLGKPDIKGHMWYGLIYKKYSEQVNPQRQKAE